MKIVITKTQCIKTTIIFEVKKEKKYIFFSFISEKHLNQIFQFLSPQQQIQGKVIWNKLNMTGRAVLKLTF